MRIYPGRPAIGLGAIVLAVLVLLGPSTASAAPSAPAFAAAGTISWSDCGNGFQCGTLTVPIDYQNPNGAKIDLALQRLPARTPAARIGSLLVNPGGPGGSAIGFLRSWGQAVSRNLRDRFDLVAFDPRGVGQSAPIVCHDTLQAFVAVAPNPHNAQEWQQVDDAAKKFVDDCQKKFASFLPFVGTKNVARDMESVRQALGEDKLTYVGYSYGTEIGQVYADMYPDHVRAFVLDGAIDVSLGFDESNRLQMVGFERAFQSYLDDCRQKQCGLAKNGDPQQAVDALLAKVDQKPLPAAGADRPAGPGETLLGIIAALYSKLSWPQLTNALLQAINNGDGTQMVNLADDYLERNSDGSYPNLIEANMAVNYVDQACPKDPKAYEQFAVDWAKSSPHFGASAASSGVTCAYWQAKADPVTVPKAHGAPPIVVISTTNDPATPYEEGVALAKELESGRLLIHRGEGHAVYVLGGDQCIDSAVNDYLLNLNAPASGTSCGNGAAPPESASSPSPTSAAGTPVASPTETATPRAGASATKNAPGPPNTGNGQSNGTARVAAIMLAFVVVAAAIAGIVVGLQGSRNRE
jgi:pimeloyl-ACP methyl ester carboxylesterase